MRAARGFYAEALYHLTEDVERKLGIAECSIPADCLRAKGVAEKLQNECRTLAKHIADEFQTLCEGEEVMESLKGGAA